MKKSFILTDVDDVLLDWIGPFQDFLHAQGISTNTPTLLDWDLSTWIKLPDNDIRRLVHEFNNSANFKTLPSFSDAKSVIRSLSKTHEIVAITSCSRDSKIVQDRILNLKKEFGIDFHNVHSLNYGEDKKEFLSKYPSSLWLEDKLEGAVQGLSCNHLAKLVNRSHNQKDNHPEVERIESWHEIVKLIDASKRSDKK